MQYNNLTMRNKIILAIIVITCFLLAGLFIYANNFILPIKLKAMLEQELSKATGKDVQIEKLRYDIFKGFIFENVEIFDKAKEKQYLSAKKISFNPLIIPIFQKNVIIPLVRVDSARVYLVYRADNTLNITDILKKPRTVAIGKAKLSFFIYKIDIDNSSCQFTDEHFNPNYTKEINDMKIGAELKLLSQIRFILQAKTINTAGGSSSVDATGDYNLFKQELNSQITINNLLAADYLPYLEKLPFLVYDGSLDADLQANLKDKKLNIQGKASTKGLRAKKQPFNLAGDVEIKPEINYNLGDKTYQYKSVIIFSNALLSGIENLKDISAIQGDILLEGNKIHSDGLKAQVLNLPVVIKGDVVFLNNQINWENISLLYKEEEYKSSGSISDFQQPKVNLQLSAKDLNLSARFDLIKDVTRIKSCSGKYKNSEFSLKGEVDAKNSLLGINTQLNLYLKDISGLLPEKIRADLIKMKLYGKFIVSGNISGNLKNIKKLKSRIKFSSSDISIYDLKPEEVRFILIQNKGLLKISNFSSRLYSGNANLQFSMDLTPQFPTYESKLVFSEINLEKLKLDTKFKDADLAGLFGLKLNLSGTTEGFQTMKGQGHASVKNGKLWELNLFKGLGELLFAPLYHKILFKEADINFNIKDNYINIDNSFLGSDQIDFSGSGKIGFNTSLDLLLHADINENLLTDSPDLRKFTSLIVGNLLDVKIGGTMQEPKYKVVPPTKEIIESIKRFFFSH